MNGNYSAGYYRAVWKLNDDAGNKLKAGLYRCVYSWNALVFPIGSHSPTANVNVSGYGDIQVN